MAKLSANGSEIARFDGITTRYSIRSNGWVLRNTGEGWKRHAKMKDPSPEGCRRYAELSKARRARLAIDRPARDYYKVALHGIFSLKYRFGADSRLASTPYIDGNERAADWSSAYRYADRAPMPTPAEWERLDRLYRAMKAESARLAQSS